MQKLLPVIGILAIIGGGVFYLNTKKSSPQTPQETMNEATEFAKAIESGTPTLCTLTKDNDKMELHIQGKKTAMTTTTTTDEKTIVGHMINDGAYIYTWDDATLQGSKMALDTLDVKDSPAPAPSAPVFDNADDYGYYQNMGYTINCQKESNNDSFFTPPTNIKFIDPTELMRAIPSPNANGEFDMSKLEELKTKYQLPVEPPTEE